MFYRGISAICLITARYYNTARQIEKQIQRKALVNQCEYFSKNKVNIVGNKAKGRISKRVFQESKARQNFRKTIISYPLIRTSTSAHQGVRNVCFSEILACFAFLKHPF